MENLSDNRILGTESIKENTVSEANQILKSKNALKKTERVTYYFCCIGSIFLTCWNDNSECQVLSNCHQVEPIGKVGDG